MKNKESFKLLKKHHKDHHNNLEKWLTRLIDVQTLLWKDVDYMPPKVVIAHNRLTEVIIEIRCEIGDK